jgi:hypothetical protein
MRFMLGLIVACGLAFWLFTPRLSAVQPSSQLRTFSQRLDDDEVLKRAASAGKLHEDVERHALRHAILQASSRVESSPCNTKLRQALHDAQEAYRRKAVASWSRGGDDPVETYTLKDGTVIETAHYFNGSVTEAARSAERARCGGD